MKKLNNSVHVYFTKRITTQAIPSVMFICLSLFFVLNANAQTSRPTPTPSREIPRVISRDSDRSKSNQKDEEVKENLDDETSNATIKLPVEDNRKPVEDTDSTTKNQKKMMLYLDLLTKTEQRAASLQQQLFDLIEKQNTYSAKIKQIEYMLRPEVISSSTALSGSLRPEDLREQRKQSLELEKANYETLIQQLDSRRSNLEESVRKSDLLVEKIRARFDAIVDAALSEDDEDF